VVLLVQQDRDDREMYAEFLRYRRFRPVIALTVAEALELAPGADVIVSGIALPNGADGLEFIAELRRAPDTSTIPIIVLTAVMLTGEQQRGVELVCDGFLHKPCLPNALVREVRRVLAAGRSGVAAPAATGIEAPRKSAARKLRDGSRRPR
jgi:CheY-like chemotaxis protein